MDEPAVFIRSDRVQDRTSRRIDRGGQHRPPIVLFRLGQGLDLDHEARARLRRGWGRVGGTPPPRPPRAAGLGHAALASRMRPPGAWAAASSSLAPALLRRDRRCGLRLTRQPPGVHGLDVRQDGCGFVGWRGGRGLGWRLRQWARMHHHKAKRCERAPAVAGRALHRPDHPVAMPPAWDLVPGPPRLLHAEGQPSLGLSPGVACLPDSARARH
jgi:hypothetical protein